MKGVVSILLLFLLAPLPLAAELLSRSELGGSLKSFDLFVDQLPDDSGAGLLSSGRFRLDATGRLLASFDFEISLEQQLLWSDPPELVSLPRNTGNRLIDAEKSWNRGGRTEAQLQLDRFNLRGELAGIRWSIGRQAIGFGRISLFSPLDVIAPFAPDALDVDVRPGVDAVKLVRYFGLGGQLGGLVVFGDQPRRNSYLLSFGENLGNLDLLLLTGTLRDRPILGVGLAGELGPLGLKGELSYYRGTEVGRPGGDLREAFVIAALEGWYRFDNGLVLIAEYFYNGPGSNAPQKYPQVATSAPLQEGLSFLLSRHYLLFGPSYVLHPLVTLNGLLIHNLQDHSSLLRPQLAISLADNLQLDLFWVFARGRRSKVDPLSGFVLPRSEFGTISDSGGLLLRWYF